MEFTVYTTVSIPNYHIYDNIKRVIEVVAVLKEIIVLLRICKKLYRAYL